MELCIKRMSYALAMRINLESLGIVWCEDIRRKASFYIRNSLYTYKHKDIFIYGGGVYTLSEHKGACGAFCMFTFCSLDRFGQDTQAII